MSLYAETSGHFVDRTVGKITDLERGDQVADAVASGIEFLAVIGVFALPVLVLLGSVRNRKVTTAVGALIGLLGVLWYRRIGDWFQRHITVLV